MASPDFQLLLVDDDQGAIRVMSQMLALYPGQRFATSGEAALRLARETVPDLILLDADMPGMSGLEVCQALKAEAALRRVPVIFVTSYDVPELQVEALRLGASDFLAKPLVEAQLTARVRAHLRAKLHAESLERDWLAAGGEVGEPDDARPRLLIVDDDVAAIRLLRQALRDIGDFYFAKSGEEALHLASIVNPHLVLLETQMSSLDGFAVCTALKGQTPFEHVPVVFVTRFSDPANEVRALDLGAADFIAKPFAPAVLGARIRNLLKTKRRVDAELRAVHTHWRKVGDARVADIVESASDAILSCDVDGRVVLANAAACRMFETLHVHLIGRPISALLGEPFLATVTAQSGPVRTVLPRNEGPATVVEAGVSVVGEGRYALTTIMLHDISVREHLMAETTARAEAEATSRTKSQMLSYIAHEMGNPLNGMLGFAQLMELDGAHPLAAAQLDRVKLILASGMHLQALMRDVMDLGAFEMGKLTIDLRSVDAVQVARRAVAEVSALAQQAGVALAVVPAPGAVWVLADARRLHQCLINLLTNAIKYSSAGCSVEVTVSEASGWARVAVRDNGIGMDKEQLGQLFEPFNRLGRNGINVPGAGLGLGITRQLMEAMQGRILVDSDPSSGTCFTLALLRCSSTTTSANATLSLSEHPEPDQQPNPLHQENL